VPNPREPWNYEEPACAEVGTALFYSIDPDVSFKGARWEDPYISAREVCGTCVHKLECAEWGIVYEEHGMWGGLTPRERAKIRARNPVKIPKIQLPLWVRR
jgi:hypothetical protein